jgi:TonB family protein
MSAHRSVWCAAAVLCALAASAQGVDPAPDTTGDREAPAAGAGSGSETPAAESADQAAPDDGHAANRGPGTRFETQISFDQKVELKEYDEAIALGAELVRLTQQEFGPDSKETANALAALAHAQTLDGRYDDAEENYIRAVDTLQHVDGVFAPSLIPVMTGLGDNYESSGDYLNAVAAYNEARTVSRRVYGLLNEGQIELLDRMTESFLEMDQDDEADKQQQSALNLMLRVYQPYEPEALAARYKYAQWLRRTRRFDEERIQYDAAERIIREHYGEDSVQMVRPLMETAASYRAQGAPVSQGFAGLEEALDILERQPDPDSLTHATLLRDIGDWLTAFSRDEPTGAEYERAWRLLADVDNGEQLREEWFSGFDFIYREPMSQRGLSDAPDAPDGYVLVRFDVDTEGRTSNARIVESVPPGFKDETVLRHLRTARFRPRIEDGKVVDAHDLPLRFTYHYSPDVVSGDSDK